MCYQIGACWNFLTYLLSGSETRLTLNVSSIDPSEMQFGNVTGDPNLSSLSSEVSINYGHLIFVCFIAIAGIIGNSITIASFLYQLRSKASDLVLLSLSFSDLSLGVIILPIEIDAVIKGNLWALGEHACYFVVWVSYTIGTASAYFILLLSWDRYRLVSLDFSKYINNQSAKKQILAIIITIVIASVPGTSELALWNFLTPQSGESFNCIVPSAFYPYLSFVLVLSYSIVPGILVSCLAILFLIHLRRRLLRFTQVGISNTESTADSTQPVSRSTASSNPGAASAGALDEITAGKSSSGTVVTVDKKPHSLAAISNAGVIPANESTESKLSENVGTPVAQKTMASKVTGTLMVTEPNRPMAIENTGILAVQQEQPNTSTATGDTGTKQSENQSSGHKGHGEKDKKKTTGDKNKSFQTSEETASARVRMTEDNKKLVKNRYIKPAITYSVLVLSLIACSTPLGLYSVVTAIACPECFDEETFLYVIFLSYSKSTLNPWINILTHQKVHQCIKKAWNTFKRRYIR